MNIMITTQCNLDCHYCFARESSSRGRQEMSLPIFKKALEFVKGDKYIEFVGIIGGEPLLHPQFQDIIMYILNDKNIGKVRIFTNGLLLERYKELLFNKKISIVINCNSPQDMGIANYKKLINNIDLFMSKKRKSQIDFGINIYDIKKDYSYFLEIIRKYNVHYNLRVAIAAPTDVNTIKLGGVTYFKLFKDYVKQFLYDICAAGGIPSFDCSAIPSCIYTEEEYNTLKNMLEDTCIRYKKKYGIRHSNALDAKPCIAPIDILPDLTAVRCFGLSKYSRVPIENFCNKEELRNFYDNTIECYKYNTASSVECLDCNKRKNKQCVGGCLAFKISSIVDLRNYGEKLMKNVSAQKQRVIDK